MRAIITKFIGCTDTKGSRIKATAGRNSATIPYPYELNEGDAHMAAAVALCNKMKWPGRLIQGGIEGAGYAFVFEPPTTAATLHALQEVSAWLVCPDCSPGTIEHIKARIDAVIADAEGVPRG